MKRSIAIGLVALCAGLVGCAGFDVKGRHGVRVYDPAYFVVVAKDSTGKFKTQTFVGPNLCSHYEIRPRSFFAKNKFSLHLKDGMASQVDDDLDTTSLLTFFQSVAEKALAAAGSAVGGTDAMDGAAMGSEGIWIWSGSRFARLGPKLNCGGLMSAPASG